MRGTIEALQAGTMTVQQILASCDATSSGADAVWHTFALACATRILDHEVQMGRRPHRSLWDAIDAKRRWLESSAPQQLLRTQQSAALQAAGRFGQTGHAFLQRIWRQITAPSTLQQIRASSRLIAVGNRSETMMYSFAALTVVTAMAPQPIEAAGQSAAAAIHYAVFADEIRASPFTLGQPGGSLQLASPTLRPPAELDYPLEAQLQRPITEEQAWQAETLLTLLLEQQQALQPVTRLLQSRQQRLQKTTGQWHTQLESALFDI